MKACDNDEKFFSCSSCNICDILVTSKIFIDCDTQIFLKILLILMQYCLNDNHNNNNNNNNNNNKNFYSQNREKETKRFKRCPSERSNALPHIYRKKFKISCGGLSRSKC